MMKKSYLLHLLTIAMINIITFDTRASGFDRQVESAKLQQPERNHRLNLNPLTKAIRVSRKNPQIANGARLIQQYMPYGEARKILAE